MGFFAVLKTEHGCGFRVEKLDVSYALLPGLFGRFAVFCDIGLRLRPDPATATGPQPVDPNGANRTIELDLCLPFVTEENEIVDLIPSIRDEKTIANLVFGNDNDIVRDIDNKPLYNDGERNVVLTIIDDYAAKRRLHDPKLGFSLWRIATAGPVGDGHVYLRVRFRVSQPGRTWSWQNGPRRRSHAISDFRVNELRELPALNGLPDFRSAMHDIESANIFMCTPSNLRVGRVSPSPTYIRILEGRGWETYLQRRIGTQASVLLITHWKIAGVTQRDPGRILLELEKRTPTPIRSALAAVGLSLLGFVLLSPPHTVAQSLVLAIVSNAAVWITGLSAATVLTAYKLIIPFLLNGRYKKINKFLRWLEKVRFQVR